MLFAVNYYLFILIYSSCIHIILILIFLRKIEDKFYILDKQYEQLKNGGVAKDNMAEGDSSETKLIAYQKQLEIRSQEFIRTQVYIFLLQVLKLF